MTGTDRLSSHTNGPTVDYYLSADQLSQSIVNNQSVVRCYMRAVNRGSGSTFYADSDASVGFSLNGPPFYLTGATVNLSGGTPNGSQFWEYGPYDVTVDHNADGTGSASLGFYVSYPSASSGGGTTSTTLPLTTIPRATTPGRSSSTVAVGSAVNITLAPASAGFSHRVWYSFGTLTNKNAGLSGGGGSSSGTDGTNGYWGTGTGNQTVTLTVPANLAAQMAGLSAQTLTVSVDTYSSGTKIGTTKTVTVSVTPAAGVVYNFPSVDGVVYRSLSDGTPAAAGVCATLTVTAAVSSINTGSQQNSLTYKWEVFAGTWQTLATATAGGLTLTAQNYTYTDSNPGTGGTQTFATTSAYQFRLTITDALGSVATKLLSMSTAAAIFDVYDEPGQPVGVGIGAIYDASVGGRIQIDGQPFKLVLADRAALNAITTSVVGHEAYMVDSQVHVRFTSTGGAYFAPAGQIIKPTSSTGGTISPNGTVTFSAVSLVSLQGVFSSLFRRYRLHFLITAGSTNHFVQYRNRLASTSAITNYDRQSHYASAAATAASRVSAQVNLVLSNPGTQAPIHDGAFDITDVALAARTFIRGTDYDTTAVGADWVTQTGGMHTTTTAYDGLDLTPSAGNFTGIAWVEGIA